MTSLKSAVFSSAGPLVVAVAGLAKNAGKTETLNHLLRSAPEGERLGVTSIGLDGEARDAVCRTPKPQITLRPGTLLATSESHYRQRRLTAEILAVSRRSGALGRTVTARAVTGGQVLLSGPPDTAGMKEVIAGLRSLGARTVLVDGALSRLSLASPSVADALVLATGAAVSGTVAGVVEKTRHVCQLASLPPFPCPVLEGVEAGVWAVDTDGQTHDLGMPSALGLERDCGRVFAHGTTLYVAGAVGDKLLAFLRQQPQCPGMTLVVRDFTRIFATAQAYRAFVRRGAQVRVVRPARLLAVTCNPQSPRGFRLDAHELRDRLAQALPVPVYDVFQE